MAVATALKVEALAKDFGSQRRLAEALGVSPAQITRWMRGDGIDMFNADKVDALEVAMSHLLRWYDAETAEDWLQGMHPHLSNRRPIDVIRAGRAKDLIDALNAERAGSYA